MVFRKSKCFTETHPQKPDHLKLGLSILRNPDHLEVEQIICERNHYKGNPCALDYTKLIRKAFVLSNCVYNFDSSSLFFESFKHATLPPQFEWLTVERTSGCALRKMEVSLVL